MFGRIAAAVFCLSALGLSGCETAAPPPEPTPVFYRDLASPTAHVDEQRALEMINQYRIRSGVAPLRLDPRLSAIAAAYARTMATTDRMGHDVDGKSPLPIRLHGAGYPFSNAGENVAAGYRTLAEAFSGWRQSPPHDRGMKDPDMTLMGIGTAYNPNSKYKVFWSLIFAHPPVAPVDGTGLAAASTGGAAIRITPY